MSNLNLSALIGVILILNISNPLIMMIIQKKDIETFSEQFNTEAGTFAEKWMKGWFGNIVAKPTNWFTKLTSDAIQGLSTGLSFVMIFGKILILILGSLFALPVTIIASDMETIFKVLGTMGYLVLAWFNVHSVLSIISWWKGAKQ